MNEVKKFNVRHVSMVAFEGAEIPGGKTVSREEFVKMRTARLSVVGQLEDNNEDVELLFTRKKESAGEFAALTEMVGKKGLLEGVFSNQRKKEKINGTTTLLRMPRMDLVTTDDKGDQAFMFTEAPVAKWASKYGSTAPEMVNFGASERGREKLQELRSRPKDDLTI
jgi:hypothetical protein